MTYGSEKNRRAEDDYAVYSIRKRQAQYRSTLRRSCSTGSLDQIENTNIDVSSLSQSAQISDDSKSQRQIITVLPYSEWSTGDQSSTGSQQIISSCSSSSNITEPALEREVPTYSYSNCRTVSSIEAAAERRRQRRIAHHRELRRPRKVVVVGDMHSGKTALVSAYCRDRFQEEYVPTILRSDPGDVKLQGVTVRLIVVDTPGRHDYARLRKCAYRKADLVMICCPLDRPDSLSAVEHHWVPEVRSMAKKVPYMIVGTRSDIREDILAAAAADGDSSTGSVVSSEQGRELSQRLGAQGYLECSAKYRDGTRKVFEQGTLSALRKHRKKRKLTSNTQDTCIIL